MKYTIEKIRTNSSKLFQFSIAVNYTKLPLNESYLTNPQNYSCSNGFQIVSIDSPTDLSRLSFKDQTHLLVINKTGNPLGTVTVSLLNKDYQWIKESNSDDDCLIAGNTSQTFGFEVLNRGIIEAYQNFNKSNEIVKFDINLNN